MSKKSPAQGPRRPIRRRPRIKTRRIARQAALILALMFLPVLAKLAVADYLGSLVNRIFVDPADIPKVLDGFQMGEEISYILETTPNAATGSAKGHGAWMTVYVPPGAEVVGAEFVLPAANGGYDRVPTGDTDKSYDGWGARGSMGYAPAPVTAVVGGHDFQTGSYAGGTGPWVGPWIEGGDDGLPASGAVRIEADALGSMALSVTNTSRSLTRTVNLSSFTAVSLTLSYRRHDLDDSADQFLVEVSPDGGSTWVPLESAGWESNDPNDTQYQPLSFDLTPYRATNTQVRLSSGAANDRKIFFDNVVFETFTPGAIGLREGRVNAVQQDTGIFFSTHSSTALVPGPNGVGLVDPTGVAVQRVYNLFDYDQTRAFGEGSALSGNGGRGNTPVYSLNGKAGLIGTGSIVAGPTTHYTNTFRPDREFWRPNNAVLIDTNGTTVLESSATLVPKILSDDYRPSDPTGTMRAYVLNQFVEARGWDLAPHTGGKTLARLLAYADAEILNGANVAFQYSTNNGATWSGDQCVQGSPNFTEGFYFCDLFAQGVDTIAELNALRVRVVARNPGGAPATNGLSLDQLYLRVEYSAAFNTRIREVGPWQRVAYENSKIGARGQVQPAIVAGPIKNTSVPACTDPLDVTTCIGHQLSSANPLPAGTNAVRFTHGKRRIGEIETARITLRVTNPLLFPSTFNDDKYCLDSTGGDTSNTAAKDNPFRYYEPQHECDFLAATANLFKEIRYVNGLPSNGASLSGGDVISFQITFSNTSAETLTNIQFSDTPEDLLGVPEPDLTLLEPGNPLCAWPSYNGQPTGPAYNAGSASSGTATWATLPNLASGQQVTLSICAQVDNGAAINDRIDNTAEVTYTHSTGTVNLRSTAGGAVSTLIAGHVYSDVDGSGDLTPGDGPTPDVEVALYIDVNGDGLLDAGDLFVQARRTLSDGSYAFAGMDAGDYLVVETDLPGWTSTGDLDNLGNPASCGAGNGCNTIGTITVVAGGSSLGNDFFDEPPSNAVNTITGTTFSDTDADGTFEPGQGEIGRGGIVVRLWRDNDGDGTVSPGDTMIDSQVSDAVGEYTFTTSETGQLVIEVDQTTLPPGSALTNTPTPFHIADFGGTLGNLDADNDFGFFGGAGTTGGVCYAVADSVDELVLYDTINATFVDLGPTGTVNIEAIAYQPATNLLYTVDADTLGTLDQSSGAFTPVAGTLGSCTLPDSTVIGVTDIDGLTFDPFTGVLWASHRRGGDDVLLTINTATGLADPSCVVVPTSSVVGLDEIDDIAIDPADGTLYAIANQNVGGVGSNDRLIIIDPSTGAVTDVGRVTLGGVGLNDVEGLGFGNDGSLAATTGSQASPTNDQLYSLDSSTAVATFEVDLFRAGPPQLSDYEAVDCLTAGANVVLGTVFADPNQNGTLEFDEVGQAGVGVNLYLDDGDGIFEPGGDDRLIQTTTTGVDGTYNFLVAALGAFWIDSDFPGSYPGGSTLTTDNVEAAVFTDFNESDADNDFGFAIPGALGITKLSSANPGNVSQGSVITYSLEPRSAGAHVLSNVRVTDAIPTGTSFLGAAPAQTSGPNPVEWVLGDVTAPVDGEASGSGSLNLGAIKDTYLNQRRTDRNYGSCATVLTDRETSRVQRTLFEFDLSALPAGAVITSAQLTLTKVDGKDDGNPVSVHRVTRQWTEGSLCDSTGDSSWLNAATGVPWTTAGGDFNATAADTVPVTVDQAYTWNVASIVQAWASGSSNFGFLLKQVPEANGGDKNQEWASRTHATAASRPQLVVTYVLPTRSTQLRAANSVVTAGDPIVATLTLRSAIAETNVAAGALTVTPANADAVNCGAPLLTSGDDDLDGTAGDFVEYQWTCDAVAGLVGGSVSFAADASGSSLAFPAGVSNSVLVSPALTFQVQVDNPIDTSITAIANTGVVASDQTPPAVDTVLDPVVFGSLGDRVWEDTNADGVQDSGEPGIDNVEVTLYLDDDGTPGPSPGDSVVTTTLTGPNGAYSFDFLPPGTYYTEVTGGLAPDLVLTTGSSNPSGVRTVLEGQAAAFDDLDFGYRSLAYDWGDLPDGPYATLAASNGPSHEVGGFDNVYLGSSVDAEADGQPSADGHGDDADAEGDDDDGIAFLSPIIAGSVVDIEVSASASAGTSGDGVGILNAWIDFNSDGDFDDPGEQIAIDLDLSSGVNLLSGISVPTDASGPMAARFRVTNGVGEGGDSPLGPATSGEVEDTMLGAVGGSVWNDLDGDGINEPGEGPVAGVVVHLLAPDGVTFVLDGNGNPITTTTDASGNYQFSGLPTIDNSGLSDPGEYRVLFDRPGGFVDFSPQDAGSNDAIDSDADQDISGVGTEGLTAIYFSLAGQFDDSVDAGLRAVTAALVTSARADVDGPSVVFEFSTGYEALSTGFEVHRFDPQTGAHEQITRSPIPALLGAPQGGVYRVEDPTAPRSGTLSYTIVELQGDGLTQVYGPFPVEVGYRRDGRAPHQGVAALPHVSTRLAERLAVSAAERSTGPLASTRDDDRASSAGTVQFDVLETGLYRVPAADLAAASGISEGKVRHMISRGGIALLHHGQNVAWMPADSDGSALYFYGEAIDSLYTLASPYRAVIGERGVSMARVGARAGAPAPGGEFLSTEDFEIDLIAGINSTRATDVDHWYWDGINAASSNNTRAFDLALPDSVGGTAWITARFGGATNGSAGDDHFAIIRVAGVEVGTASWNGLDQVEFDFEFDGSLLTPLTTVEVEGLLANGSTSSIFFIDGFEVRYPRTYRAVSDELHLSGDGNGQVTVDGFASPDPVVLELKENTLPRRVVDLLVTASGGGYAATFQPTDAAVAYYATTFSAARSASGFRPVVAEHDLGATYHRYDHLVVAPGDWMGEARMLADYHRRTGLRSLAVSAEEIYDTFSNGEVTPWAIRDFLRHTASWSRMPQFAVLLGRGTLDPRNLLGGGDNFLPVVQAGTPYGLIPSDNVLADIKGDDDVPELAIGRLPFVSGAEVAAYIAKLEQRDAATGPWRGRALLVADNPDAAGDFTAQSEEVAALLAGYETSEVYLEHLPVDEARAALEEGINHGARWVNYVGHGGVTQMAGEGLLRTSDMDALVNFDRLPVISALTCVIGRSDIPNLESLAEALVTDADGGAIAVWAPSGLSLSGSAHELNMLYIEALAAREGQPLGSAVLDALTLFGENGGSIDMLKGYAITGDPGLVP